MLVYKDDVALEHLPKVRHSRNVDQDKEGEIFLTERNIIIVKVTCFGKLGTSKN